jgi:hypothetical protein
VPTLVGDPGTWLPPPDGRWLLGIEALGDGRWQFVLRDITTGATQAFPSSAGNVGAANAGWADDSSAIAYFDARDGEIKRLSIGTGQVESVAEARDCRGVAWSGALVVCADNQPIDSSLRAYATNLRAVDAESGASVALDAGDTRGTHPTPLGGGRFLLRRGAGDAGVVGPGLAPAVAVPGGNSSVFAAGHVFYVRDQTLPQALE